LPANGDDFHCFKFNYNWFVWLHNYLMLASVTCEASSPPPLSPSRILLRRGNSWKCMWIVIHLVFKSFFNSTVRFVVGFLYCCYC
jgi:hypothetical protein